MRKFLVAVLTTVVVIAALAAVTAVWDRSAAAKREQSAQRAVETVVPQDRISSVDIHGLPHIMYQVMDMDSTAYVDVKPSGQAKEEQFIVNNVKDDSYGNFTRLLRFPKPSAEVKPAPNPDGSFTNKATVNGEPMEYTVVQDTVTPGGNLQIRDQTGKIVVDSPLETKKTAHIGQPFVMDDNISVDVSYDADSATTGS
ncbi:hypothetical protein [Kocuria massiliensis]|uniref:hypothetical protein n=1 Tax=Kocuria massiliensis TaxID=1926282 RepID=UPI0022B9BB0E|nr:hypothetical protein [Kocuria massiliensis]